MGYGNENQPPIVHGALLMSLVAGVIGSDFPGPGTLVLSQEMTFIAACPAGSNISIEIALENNQSATKIRKITYCNFACYNNDDKSILFMKGKAKLRIRSLVWFGLVWFVCLFGWLVGFCLVPFGFVWFCLVVV